MTRWCPQVQKSARKVSVSPRWGAALRMSPSWHRLVVARQAGVLTSQGLIEKMYHSIIIDGTDVETAAKDCEKKLNEAFKAAGASIK